MPSSKTNGESTAVKLHVFEHKWRIYCCKTSRRPHLVLHWVAYSPSGTQEKQQQKWWQPVYHGDAVVCCCVVVLLCCCVAVCCVLPWCGGIARPFLTAFSDNVHLVRKSRFSDKMRLSEKIIRKCVIRNGRFFVIIRNGHFWQANSDSIIRSGLTCITGCWDARSWMKTPSTKVHTKARTAALGRQPCPNTRRSR